MIINWLRQLKKVNYDTLNRVELNRAAILHNLKIIKTSQESSQIIPVLKANAYGHGLKEMATILNDSTVKMVAVDSFPEAQIVYRYFKGRVLIIGEMPLAVYKHLKWSRTEVCVYNSRTLSFLAGINRLVNVHLFVNTGMNREGISDLKEFLDSNEKDLAKLTITGICSHLHSADSSDEDNDLQLKVFLKNLDILEDRYGSLKYVHLANSAGSFCLHHKRLTAIRPGLAVYGINPFSEDSIHFQKAAKLKAALQIFTKVVSVQDVLSGEFVSYNRSYMATKKMKLAIIPFGYSEGLDRRLSNIAQFKLAGKYYQVAGNVCMNLTCLALSTDTEVEIGQEVQIVSAHAGDPNSIINLAKLQKTITHEVLIEFLPNIRRIIVDK